MPTLVPQGVVLLAVTAFVAGSIPFGLVVGRLVRGVDLRQVGSRNIGAANAFRTLGPALGGLVLLLDAAKGCVPVLLVARVAGSATPDAASSDALAAYVVLVGMCAIIGHNYSLFLGFKGGKGIATMFGVLLAISPLATLIAALAWALAFAATRYASVGSLCAATSIPLCFLATHAPTWYTGFGALVCVMAFVRHRTNLANLVAGRELRLGAGASELPANGSAEGSSSASARD